MVNFHDNSFKGKDLFFPKAISESMLGWLYTYAWCAWTVLECSFNVKDFSCCANRDSFHRSSHIYSNKTIRYSIKAVSEHIIYYPNAWLYKM